MEEEEEEEDISISVLFSAFRTAQSLRFGSKGELKGTSKDQKLLSLRNSPRIYLEEAMKTAKLSVILRAVAASRMGA
jgi:hypothetical protein